MMFSTDLTVNNGNRTEWSPIRSVIIRLVNKIRRPRGGSPICYHEYNSYRLNRRFHGPGRHLGSGANAAKFTVNVWGKL